MEKKPRHMKLPEIDFPDDGAVRGRHAADDAAPAPAPARKNAWLYDDLEEYAADAPEGDFSSAAPARGRHASADAAQTANAEAPKARLDFTDADELPPLRSASSARSSHRERAASASKNAAPADQAARGRRHAPAAPAAQTARGLDHRSDSSAPHSGLSRGKKIALGVCAAVLVIAIALTASVLVYMGNLRSTIAYEGDFEALSDVLTDADYQQPFYVLCIGVDRQENRSDIMVLLRIDLNRPQLTFVSIPRDTPYLIDGETVKLNTAYKEGGEVQCIEAVSALTGVPISHYVEVNFDQINNVVEAMGGVKVDVPLDLEDTAGNVVISAGEQVLNGEQALLMARTRLMFHDSQDALRQSNVRLLLLAMLTQVLNLPPAEIPAAVANLATMVTTDIPLESLIDWAVQVSQAGEMVVYTCTGPFEGDNYGEDGIWLTYEAPEQWAEIMELVDSGRDPTTVDVGTTIYEDDMPLETKQLVKTGGTEEAAAADGAQ